MDKIDALNQVAEFHQTFKHPVVEQPAIPDEKRCQLRISLLSEELKELEDAVHQQDITSIADALCDIQYVLSGAVLEFGLGQKFSALFDEVQRSNMSKACHSQAEAEATMQYYLDRDGTQSYYQEHNGLYLVYRQSDNKTLKSINYSPPNLEKILNSTE